MVYVLGLKLITDAIVHEGPERQGDILNFLQPFVLGQRTVSSFQRTLAIVEIVDRMGLQYKCFNTLVCIALSTYHRRLLSLASAP